MSAGKRAEFGSKGGAVGSSRPYREPHCMRRCEIARKAAARWAKTKRD